MGDDIGLGLSPVSVCFDSYSTNIVQLSNRNPWLYRFQCHHPLITQLNEKSTLLGEEKNVSEFNFSLHNNVLTWTKDKMEIWMKTIIFFKIGKSIAKSSDR